LYYSQEYLSEVDNALKESYGLFEVLIAPLIAFQKGDQRYDFFLTTGGIRGGSEKIGKFQPRSFNMGLSRKRSTLLKALEIYILRRSGPIYSIMEFRF
jgi:hypothetical protein